MSKRFYIATRKDREDEANRIAEALKPHGWERTFTWTGHDVPEGQRYAMIAQAELSAVKDADVLIAMLPGGFGTHVEIGAALALGKLVILHSPDQATLEYPYPCVFHYHPGVKLLVSTVMSIEQIVANMCEG